MPRSTLLFIVAIACCLPAHAKDKPTYQDATLVSFHTSSNGSHCSSSGSVNGNADDAGKITGTTSSSTDCHATSSAYYTITLAGQTFVLTPKVNPADVGAAMLTFGMSSFFRRDSVLYGQLPGTPIKVRSDGGTFIIKVGKRETAYKLVSAQ